jgi:hypothetical protein
MAGAVGHGSGQGVQAYLGLASPNKAYQCPTEISLPNGHDMLDFGSGFGTRVRFLKSRAAPSTFGRLPVPPPLPLGSAGTSGNSTHGEKRARFYSRPHNFHPRTWPRGSRILGDFRGAAWRQSAA